MKKTGNNYAFILIPVLFLAWAAPATGRQAPRLNQFRQLYQELPAPNAMRTASGMPGPGYWQQKVDYEMQVELDDESQRIYGREHITYHNNAPVPLAYLWLQLDQNRRARDSIP